MFQTVAISRWIKAGKNPRIVTLYLSPDQRFLSNSLYDLKAPPENIHEEASHVLNSLLSDQSPQKGNGSHVLVIFSDLQCPYCASLAGWIGSLPESDRSRLRFVYKHFPLPQHNWAMAAAQLTACISDMAPDGFWPVYDYIYSSQSDLTSESLEHKVLSKLAQLRVAGVEAVSSCYKAHGASATVERDIALGKRLHVRQTPTLFLDGFPVVCPIFCTG